MKSLNEQLAELCGYEYVTNGHGCFVSPSPAEWRAWNPTTDLNQLRMCYEALNHIELVHFSAHLYDAYIEAGFTGSDSASYGIMWLTRIMFTCPELVAQAILKAKGVSL